MEDDQGQLADEQIKPLRGNIIPVKTIQETQPDHQFAEAYVVEVNQKSASQVIKVLDTAFRREPSSTLGHLRRFAKASFLPDHLKSTLREDLSSSQQQTIYVLIYPPIPDETTLRNILAPFVPAPLYVTDGADSTNDAGQQTATAEASFPLVSTTVPLQPPLNPEQAVQWSKAMWPVTYNPAAARVTIAPPLHILNQVQDSLRPKAASYLALAYKVAGEAKRSRRGRGVGVVVVDPSIDTTESSWQQGIVAGAGDARYCAPGVDTSQLDLDGSYNPDIEGGPELHATMRAIEMIASLRRAGEHIASAATTTTTTITNDNPQIHKPRLTPLETQYLRSSFPSSSPPSKRRKPDNSSQLTDEQTPAAATDDRVVSRSPQAGYLCTDLDIYITHEPCLSCSMGILLSRFRAVIFSRRGRLKTGGLASEPVCDGDQRPYYGLHWRKELNWRALCFEFVEDGEGNGDWKNQELVEDGLEFHA